LIERTLPPVLRLLIVDDHPAIRVLMLTSYPDEEAVFAAIVAAPSATPAEAACVLTAAPGRGSSLPGSFGLGQSATQSVARAEELSVEGLRGKVDSMA
jgi:hypothetical protein